MSNRFYIIPVLCLLFLSLMTGAAYAQDGQRVTVTGTVVDGQGEPVIGAGIVVKGTTEGTITDLDGKFSIEAEAGTTLVVSFIGMDSYEFTAEGQKNLNVVLHDDTMGDYTELHLQAVNSSAFRRLGNHGKRMLAACQTSICNEPVFSFRKVYHHTVVLGFQCISRLGPSTDPCAVLIVDIQGQAVHLRGEAVGILHDKDDIGPVELATMSFGQTFQITPIQLLTRKK